MGASKREHEKMTYFITTEPLTEREFFENFMPSSKMFKDWTREPNDYDLYKDNEEFKELNKNVKNAKKLRDNFKEQIRKQNK